MELLDWLKKKNPTRPKNLDTPEEQIIDIFESLLENSSSELHYDPERFECFVECEPYFMVLEAGKAIIVNSIYSHEVRMSNQTEMYLSFIFGREVSKRRQAMKGKYLSKVEKNLGNILTNVRKISK